MNATKRIAKRIAIAMLGLMLVCSTLAETGMTAFADTAADVKDSISKGEKTVTAIFCVLRKGEAVPDESQIANRSVLKFYNTVAPGRVYISDDAGNYYSYTAEYPYEDKGDAEYEDSSRLLPGYSGDVSRYIAGDVDLSPIFNDQNPLKDDEYVRWYVIKRENDYIHVDGVVEKKPYYDIVINYGYYDGENNFVQLDQTTLSVMQGSEYTKDIKTIAGYTTSEVKETFLADGNRVFYVVYSAVATPVVANAEPNPIVEEVVEEEVVEEVVEPVDTTQNQTVTPVEVEDDTINLTDDDTPLGNSNLVDTEGDMVEISEDDIPLSIWNCLSHNIMLLLLLVYIVYQVARAVARNRRIADLKDVASQKVSA